MKKNVIAIPIYKKELSNFEWKSINRAIEIFNQKNDIVLVHPKNLDLSYYKNNFTGKFFFRSFDNEYFNSVVGYNKLMLSVDFYKKFSDYEYMLIYQTDSYVFIDELEYWCSKEHDYIGGIWFEGFTENPEDGAKLFYPGNGGFSLRKISSVINLLSSNMNIFTIKDILNIEKIKSLSNIYGRGKIFILFKLILNCIGFTITSQKLAKKYKNNEDVFFVEMSNIVQNFNIPKVEEAIFFAWDRCPSYLIEKYKKLPMGCHAWYRNDYPYQGNLGFWQKIID